MELITHCVFKSFSVEMKGTKIAKKWWKIWNIWYERKNLLYCRQASYRDEEVNLLRQEVNSLKARLQMAGSPRRESPGVGVGTEEQVGLLDKNAPCRYFLMEFLLARFCPKLNTWLSWKECCATAVKDIKNSLVFIFNSFVFFGSFCFSCR